MRALLQDLRYAIRSLRKSPGFTIAAGLALAIGIGANTALFSVVNAVLLQPLAFPASERLVMLHESLPKMDTERAPFSTIEYGAFSAAAKSYDGLGAFESITGELSSVSPAEFLNGVKMTAGLFEVLGTPPMLGRTFRREEDYDGNSVALLSYGLWTQRFGRDPAVVGRTIQLDRVPRTIIGVMPESFVFPLRWPSDNNEPAAFYVPMGFSALEKQGRGPILQKSVIGRLKAGTSIASARAEAQTLQRVVLAALPAAFQPSFAGLSFQVQSLHTEVTGKVGRILWLLMGAVGVLLLIACASVANLTLTRAAGRSHERAIRAALGASRGALLRSMLCENLVLAFGGGIIGLAIAVWSRPLLVALSPIQMPRAEEVRLDVTVVAFAFLVAILAALLSGVAAMLPSARAETAASLKEGGRSASAGQSRGYLLGALVSAQFAFTMVLLVGGSLMFRSLLNTIATDPGFRPERAVVVTTHLPPYYYSHAAQVRSTYLQIANNAEAAPGITAAGIGTEIPLGNWEKGSIVAETFGSGDSNPKGPIASQIWITGHYLEALGVPLKRGRFPSDVEYREPRGVVVINESLARKLWPGQDAVGRRLRNSRIGWQTVVGVVADIKEVALNAPPVPQIYEPHSQLPDRLLEMTTIPFFKTLNLVGRSANGSATSIRELTDVIHKADASLAISSALPLGAVITESSRPQRLNAFLIGGFGGIAFLLAVFGVASVLGYSVVQRTNEIGIRMALGATPASVSGIILKRGLFLALAGIAAGLAASLVVTRLLANFLYGVSARDPLTFVLVPLVLAVTAVAAAWLPARRAARVDPLVSLRAQ